MRHASATTRSTCHRLHQHAAADARAAALRNAPGNFLAAVEDDGSQVCPTAWVEEAMARWVQRSPRGEMMAAGVDVARGGRDSTVIACRHEGNWSEKAKVYAGKAAPDGPNVAGLVVLCIREDA